MILNNKASQKLEIIGFKESVMKSTSRIQDIIKIGQTYGTINEETDVHVNGAINIVGADFRKIKKVKVYANLCNEAGEILYILNCWKNYSVEERGYFSFSMYCSTVNRFFDIEDLEYAEIYVVFNEKDGK